MTADTTTARREVVRFHDQAEATQAGWVFNAPPTEEHRGWLIIWEKGDGGFRVTLRERSGRVENGRIRFRMRRIARRDRPAMQTIFMDEYFSLYGFRLSGGDATSRSEIARVQRLARRRIDWMLDGSHENEDSEVLE